MLMYQEGCVMDGVEVHSGTVVVTDHVGGDDDPLRGLVMDRIRAEADDLIPGGLGGRELDIEESVEYPDPLSVRHRFRWMVVVRS